MRKLLTAVLFATAVLAVPTANAEDDGAGLTCGFASTTDPTSHDPNQQIGEVDAHVTLHNSSGGLSSLTVTCTIQINSAVYGFGGVARSNTCTPPGSPTLSHVIVCNVGDTFTYSPAPGDDVYLCTEISWSSSKGGGIVQYDGDDVTAGNQCALTTSVEAEEINRSVGPDARTSGRPWCVWVSDIVWVCGPP